MPTSFRKSHLPPPFRYRTPSPPRDAHEPLSPYPSEDVIVRSQDLQRANNRETRDGSKRPCPAVYADFDGCEKLENVPTGAMDAFASIALATTSDPLHILKNSRSPQSAAKADDRPAKRAKSEKLSSPDWSKRLIDSGDRPATSYSLIQEDRRLEAELLLNFAHANFAQVKELSAKLSVEEPHSVSCFTPNISTMKAVIPDGDSNSRTEDGQRPVIGQNQDPYSTCRKPFSQELQQDGPFMGDNLFSGQTFLGANLNAHQIAFEAVDGQWKKPGSNFSDHMDVASHISEHDHVDLVHRPSSLEQDVCTTQEDVFKAEGSLKTPDTTVTIVNPASIVSTEQEHLNESSKNKSESSKATLSTDVNVMSTGEIRDVAKLEGLGQSPGQRIEEGSYPACEELRSRGSASTGWLGSTFQENSSSTSKPESRLGYDKDGGVSDCSANASVTTAVCAACRFVRNSKGIEAETESTFWIRCDACKAWFHFACAGFKSEREVRGVDKFRCRKCKPTCGSTTYVRKSSRAHSAIDYAGLHQGVIKTSDERPEHHYIKPIKEGTITFLPENFTRMRPELVTAEYFEKGSGMKEPIVIPAYLNTSMQDAAALSATMPSENDDTTEEWYSEHPICDNVPDYGQDGLDMVVPQALTVRQVAELYGPEEKVEVIDVKSQNGENKKWNMRRWADYYENPNNKVVRNVISLEVSQSRLGRLIKRPQIVRDLDLQDSVWPEELLAKGEYPRVQFYCLMSVADCFTDFHIDFGGSSVFYHILKGKKTFLFIPPKEKHLKKYEEWCMSPAQNWTFLGDQTKECYRVDLSEGDTMLIPSGWIHAVWTPEDSLVIGGNFLTRMSFGMQLRVAQVEKATGVARKFRYPHFQKLHWYVALRYLQEDPVPANVRDLLHRGGVFRREVPAYHGFDAWGENSRAGLENYQARYYSQPELEGLPDLARYLFRTALIDMGSITDGISAEARNAVKKSIPRGHGEPLDIIKTFAAWCAWKRGNEPIPHWAYPEAVPENLSPDKLSASAMKKLDREAALSAPRRQSARMQLQQELSGKPFSEPSIPSTLSSTSVRDLMDQSHFDSDVQRQIDSPGVISKKPGLALGTGFGSHRKTACESCRKRRRACKHKDQVAASMTNLGSTLSGIPSVVPDTNLSGPTIAFDTTCNTTHVEIGTSGLDDVLSSNREGANVLECEQSIPSQTSSPIHNQVNKNKVPPFRSMSQGIMPEVSEIHLQMSGDAIKSLEPVAGNTVHARPRHKACNECRKSKVGDS